MKRRKKELDAPTAELYEFRVWCTNRGHAGCEDGVFEAWGTAFEAWATANGWSGGDIGAHILYRARDIPDAPFDPSKI